MTSHLSTQQKITVDSQVNFIPLQCLDAAQNIFIERELKAVIPELFEFTYAKINGRSLFPIDRSAGPNAKTIAWQQLTKVGVAKIITDYADDIPIVNAFREEKSQNVRTLGDATQWSVDEIRAAAATGVPLDRAGVDAANEAIMRLENSIIFFGDATHGLIGLFSAGIGIPSGAVPNGGWGTTATGLEMVEDMNAIVHAIPTATGDIEAATALLLPTSAYNIAASTPVDAGGLQSTALKYFLDNNQYVSRVERVRELETAGPGGVRAMVAYDPNPSKIRLAIPMDISSEPPQNKDLAVKVIYREKLGGLIPIKPLSLNIGHTF